MTREEFIARCEAIIGYSPRDRYGYRGVKENPTIEIKWTVGGKTGGSCYGTEERRYEPREIEPEPDFEVLDQILEDVRPEMTFFQYKALVRELVQSDTQNDGDYYGNDNIKARKRVDLFSLYKYLKEKGWV